MATFGPLKNAYLMINNKDLSDHVKSVELKRGSNMLDNNAMGTNTVLQRSGLHTWSITASFFQDFGATSIHATLGPLLGAANSFPIVMRADTGAVAATNPQWSGMAYLSDYTPVGGSHGENLMAPVTFAAASDLTETTTTP